MSDDAAPPALSMPVLFVDLSDDPPLQEALARVRAAGGRLRITLESEQPPKATGHTTSRVPRPPEREST